ncbi:MAG: hypothetical protein AVDCRST_MAG68-5225 [uncultured Gemmatimonadetes bacterium]|uniref:Uncharacterized protein n=1 Tax=uncultured Gemmatimonadota bacterium TaxID=203437 RepID=A0A6J4MWV7_9BACT|nr:MAG: hypothetical protein AVDCRST_MAG68-5225 [uncultured Gemmatimonadota bacterium]
MVWRWGQATGTGARALRWRARFGARCSHRDTEAQRRPHLCASV